LDYLAGHGKTPEGLLRVMPVASGLAFCGGLCGLVRHDEKAGDLGRLTRQDCGFEFALATDRMSLMQSMAGQADAYPRISFIIPTLNGGAAGQLSLSITRQTYPRDRYEIHPR